MTRRRGARLVGLVNPIGLTPAFVIPIFRYGNSNELLVQVIGGDGLVKAFQQIEIHDLPLHEIPERTVITSGDLSLWAFEFAPSDYAVGAQAAISKTLAGRRNELRRHPLLDLQVLRFRA